MERGEREGAKENKRSTAFKWLMLENCTACVDADSFPLAYFHANARYRGIALKARRTPQAPHSTEVPCPIGKAPPPPQDHRRAIGIVLL